METRSNPQRGRGPQGGEVFLRNERVKGFILWLAYLVSKPNRKTTFLQSERGSGKKGTDRGKYQKRNSTSHKGKQREKECCKNQEKLAGKGGALGELATGGKGLGKKKGGT